MRTVLHNWLSHRDEHIFFLRCLETQPCKIFMCILWNCFNFLTYSKKITRRVATIRQSLGLVQHVSNLNLSAQGNSFAEIASQSMFCVVGVFVCVCVLNQIFYRMEQKSTPQPSFLNFSLNILSNFTCNYSNKSIYLSISLSKYPSIYQYQLKTRSLRTLYILNDLFK